MRDLCALSASIFAEFSRRVDQSHLVEDRPTQLIIFSCRAFVGHRSCVIIPYWFVERATHMFARTVIAI